MDSFEISMCEIVASIVGGCVYPHQRLYQDLGLAGDDAFEVFEKVSERYGTRFESLRFGGYFLNESEALPERLERRVGLAKERKAVTVGHLAAVAQRGDWFELFRS